MNLFKKLVPSLLIAAAVAGSTGVAFAKDSKGLVTSIMIDNTNYMALRVKLSGVSSFCDGNATTPHIAYLAMDNVLYDTILKAVTSAYMAGKQITIRASQDGNYCRITGAILE